MKQFAFSLLAFLLTASTLVAQAVLLRNGIVHLPANTADFDRHDAIAEKVYRLIQFEQIPSAQQHRALQQAGLQLLEYVPHRAYVAAIPTAIGTEQLLALGIRSITSIPLQLKMSDNLRDRPFPEWAMRKDKITAVLKYYAAIPLEDVLAFCQTEGIEIIRHNGFNNFLHVAIHPNKLESISAKPFVAYLELAPEPGQPEDVPGRGLHRANAIDTEMPSGRHYTGEEVKVLVRDDGLVGPHIDFQGRISQDVTGDGGIDHADGVSGIFAGSGNRDPRMRGMAAGAFLYVIDYQADFLDNTLPLHTDADVLVTNSSYSDGCNSGYTSNAATVDQQLFSFPTFMHVFSAGNSNGSNCNYGAGTQWGNITGGHKQSKNSIATANLFADAALVNSSSRGPAYDGRIKPDISANGQDQFSTDPNHQYAAFGGTSGAAPGIAGITAQLHQAYREYNPGTIADGALLKAVLLNTANEMGNPGPDFKYGWGHVNAYRAVLTIEENRFFSGTIDNGISVAHAIAIPDGVKQAKIMVYWSDREGSELAAKALVANLDATLDDGNGNLSLPWILDHTPNAALLDLPATTGVDTLNNMEQIALDNPAAGDYLLQITGTEVPFPGQKYWVTYEFIFDEITLTYPNGGEGLAPGDVERIHWDAHGSQGNIIVEYSTDNGASWTSPATLSGNARMYNWTVPAVITGQAFVRISRDGVVAQNQHPFSIVAPPGNLQITQACPEFVRLEWDSIPGANAYDVFLLGQQYMDSVGTTSELYYDIPAIGNNPNTDHWVSVRAAGENGLRSRRAVAILWNQGLLNCALDTDLAVTQILSPGNALTACGGAETEVRISVWNNGITEQSSAAVSYQIDSEPPVTEIFADAIASGDTVVYVFATPAALSGNGPFTLKTWVMANSGIDQAVFNDTLSMSGNAVIYPGDGAPIGVVEDFQGAIPPDYWQILNPDNNISFEPTECTGPSGQTTIAMRVNNYAYNAAGQEDVLVSLPFDLGEANENTLLTFDLAYAIYNLSQYWDALRIDVYTDCGNTFAETVYYKEKDVLATIAPLTQPYTPNNANQWRKEVVSLAQFAGQSIVVHFVNITGYGNNLYIDNVNVGNYIAPTAGVFVSDSIVCQSVAVDFQDNSQGENLNYQWSFGQGAVPGTATGPGPHNVVYNTAGVKTARLIINNGVLADTAFQIVEVEPQPVANFGFSIANGTVSFTNNSQFGLSYHWDFGDGDTSTLDNPVHSFQSTGSYQVTLTVTNDCGTKQVVKTVQVVISSTDEINDGQNVRIIPNPNSGVFDILLEGMENQTAELQILDATGRQVWSGTSARPLSVDLSERPKGVYWLMVRTDRAAQTFKIVIQ